MNIKEIIAEEHKSLKAKEDSLATDIIAEEHNRIRESNTFSLGGGGMRQLERLPITLEKGAVYALGASSSPDLVFIMKADDRSITYRKWPYKKDLRIERMIGEDLINRGTKAWLKFGRDPAISNSMKSGLKGGKVKRFDLEDFQRFEVQASPTKGGMDENWRDAEQYGGVGWVNEKGSEKGYFVITMNGAALKKIKKDNNYKVIKVEKD